MRIVIDDTTKEVHLLGLALGDMGLIEACLAEKAVVAANDNVSARAIKLITLIDAGYESMLAAHLGGASGEEIELDNL